MKRLLLYSFLFCSAFLQGLHAQDVAYNVFSIPDSLVQKANEVVRTDRQIFTVESLRSGKLACHRAVTILNEKSDANVQVLYYDKESKIKKLEAKLYNAFGQLIREAHKSEIIDQSAISDFSMYEDNRVKVLEILHSEYPYTVVFDYEIELKGIQYCTYPNWRIQDYAASVQEASFTISLPAGMRFFHRALNIELTPEVKKSQDREFYTWSVRNLPAIPSEPNAPSRSAVLPALLTAPDQFQWGAYQGSMASWKDYGIFMHELFKGRDVLPESVRQEVRRIATEAGEGRSRINALYRYLQTNMRYVSVQLGIGGWQPFDAQYVSEKKYGDCKALTNFMKAVLKEAGIEAYPALIYSGRLDYDVEEDFMTPTFNHVILYVPSEDYWLECTSNDFPPNYVGQSNSGRNALLIKPTGGELKRTPELSSESNLETHRVVVEINPEGSARVEVRANHTGADHEQWRYMMHGLSHEEAAKNLIQNSSLPSFSLVKLEIEAAKDRPESSAVYVAQVSRYATKAGKRFFVPLNAVTAYGNVPSALETRRHPVVIQRGYTERDEITLQMPVGYQIESTPDAVTELKTEFGSYRLEFERDAEQNKLVCKRELVVKAGTWPADRYTEYRDFFKQVAKSDGMKAVLVEKKT